MTLRARLALVVAGAVAIAVVAAVAVAWLATQSRLRGEVDRELAERAAALADVPAVGDLAQRATRPGAGAGLRPARPFPGIRMALVQDLSVQIVGADGAVTALAGAEVPVTAVDRAVAAAGTGEVGHDARVDGDHFRVAVAGVDGGGAVLVARDVSATDRTLRGLALLLTVVALGGVAAAAAVGLLVARRALRPIDELSAAAERVARDQDLTAPLPPPRAPDEVGRLTASFNTMLAALATSRAQQHRLVADAGHELRTPLTSLRTTIELLRRADRRGGATLPAAQRDELYEHAIEELGELTHLTDELVELATDARSTPEERDTVALREVVEAVATRAGRRTGRPVEVTADDTTVHGRRAAIERAVSNLVDNAAKWSPAGAPVEVTLDAGRVHVRDHGPGVPADERARVFERFARGREAEAVPGSGLGLAIVAQVAADHGGRAWLDAPADGGSGTVATLDLSPARFSADSQRTPRATFKDGAEPGPVADPGHASPPATPPEPPRSTP